MTKGRSRLVVGLAIYFAIAAAYSLYIVAAAGLGTASLGKQLYEVSYIAITAAIAYGLYRHLRWAMWLYFVSTAFGLAVWAAGDPLAGIDPRYHTSVIVAAVLLMVVPGVLMWIRRDRLSSTSIEPRNA